MVTGKLPKSARRAKASRGFLSTIRPDHMDICPNDRKPIPKKKSYREILQEEIITGRSEFGRPSLGLFLSGISAGLDVGFSLLVAAITLTLVWDLHPVLRRILFANAYSVGFVFVNLGRSELFTEHTTLSMFPVLNRHESLLSLLRVWVVVYAGNLIGGGIFAAFAPPFGIKFAIIDPGVLTDIARHLTQQQWWVIVVSGILAGWAMGLVSWLVAATVDTIGQIVCVWLVTAVIGFAQLHHCIAGNVEVLAGFWNPSNISIGDYWHFLSFTTLGNIIGGMIFAVIKYAHAIRSHNGRWSTP